MQSFQETGHYIFQVGLVLKPLAIGIGRLIACGASIDKQTNGQMERQTKYCIPRCAYRPRVNEGKLVPEMQGEE